MDFGAGKDFVVNCPKSCSFPVQANRVFIGGEGLVYSFYEWVFGLTRYLGEATCGQRHLTYAMLGSGCILLRKSEFNTKKSALKSRLSRVTSVPGREISSATARAKFQRRTPQDGTLNISTS